MIEFYAPNAHRPSERLDAHFKVPGILRAYAQMSSAQPTTFEKKKFESTLLIASKVRICMSRAQNIALKW